MTYIPFELEKSWQEVLKEELKKPYLLRLSAFLEKERKGNLPVYPPQELVFNAFSQTPFNQVKVVIMGQDPYHGAGQAHGLCFSVPQNFPLPPSLQNIFKELEADLGIPRTKQGCLLPWAKQGVFLPNALLTVREGLPMSHQGQGWEQFTDAAIEALAKRDKPVIFVLWGKTAQEKCKNILDHYPNKGHSILKAPHPSPLSANTGFFGCKVFSKVNDILKKQSEPEIDWRL
jgi:uracil-DNA glycosylase